jgi:hypothetical protein
LEVLGSALAGVSCVDGVLVCYGVLVFWCKPHRLQHQGTHTPSTW